ncbi:MAG: HAD family hydrolase [Clostridia bacterium]|nr:HAD family hydrolase [Clostridia bacterium]
MAIKAVLFDLDGTLLPMNLEEYLNVYLSNLAKKVEPLGYGKKEFIASLWAATEYMVKNDGSRTNEEVFWKEFSKIHGETVYGHIPVFNSYYTNEYNLAKEVCGFDPMAAKTVEYLKNRGMTLVCATNPLLPYVAMQSRLSWAGVDENCFSLITAYENSRFSKPFPGYYLEILSKIGKKPEECIMVGNDVSEDMPAKKTGMNVFLLTNCLIDKNGEDISAYPNGGFSDLVDYIESIK